MNFIHLYIVVDCKTPKCDSFQVLTHLGEKGKVSDSIQCSVPVPLLIECMKCGQTHDYSDSQDRFQQVELPYPPPSDYSNKI
jgi:hypothetical protein